MTTDEDKERQVNLAVAAIVEALARRAACEDLERAEREVYFTTVQASKFLSSRGLAIAHSTLAKLRCIGGGPHFVKFGRKVVYTQKALQDWVTNKLSAEVASTSELP
jgi:hypothetical protein